MRNKTISIRPYKNNKYKLYITKEIKGRLQFSNYIISRPVADLIKEKGRENFKLQMIINYCKDDIAKKKKEDYYATRT